MASDPNSVFGNFADLKAAADAAEDREMFWAMKAADFGQRAYQAQQNGNAAQAQKLRQKQQRAYQKARMFDAQEDALNEAADNIVKRAMAREAADWQRDQYAAQVYMPPAGQPVMIVAAHSGQAVTAFIAGPEKKQKEVQSLQQQPAGQFPKRQQFKIVPSDKQPGFFNIQKRDSVNVHIRKGEIAGGNDAIMWKGHGGPAQQYFFAPAPHGPPGAFMMICRKGGGQFALTINGGSFANGGEIVLRKVNPGKMHQKFFFAVPAGAAWNPRGNRIREGIYNFRAAHSGLTLTKGKQFELKQGKDGMVNKQAFRIINNPARPRFFWIQHVKTGLNVGVGGKGDMTGGNSIVLEEPNMGAKGAGIPRQLWRFRWVPESPGYFAIICKKQGPKGHALLSVDQKQMDAKGSNLVIRYPKEIFGKNHANKWWQPTPAAGF